MSVKTKSDAAAYLGPIVDASIPFLSAPSLSAVLAKIAENACTLMDADASAIALFDRRAKKFSAKASYHLEGLMEESDGYWTRRWRSVKGVTDLRAFLKEKGNKGKAKWAERERLISMVYAPIFDSRGFSAALNVYYRSPHRLTAKEKDSLAVFARYAGVGIENAQTFEKALKAEEESGILYQLSHTLISTLDVDRLLDEILKVTQERFGYLNCSIHLLDESKTELHLRAARGYSKTVIERVRRRSVEDGVTGFVCRTGIPTIVPDVEKEPRYIRGREDARSEITLPLAMGDEVIGVLDVESSQVNAFTDKDLKMLSSLAAQASLVINNATLYQGLESRVRELDLLNRIARYVSGGLGFKDTLKHIIEGVKRLIDYDAGRIYFLDRKRQILVPMTVRYDPKEYPYPYTELVKKTEIKVGEGLTGWVAKTGQAVIVGDAERDRRVKHLPGTPYRDESLLAVPLLSEGKVIGVITLAKLGLNQFGLNELRLLTILANQAAGAIENARLYEETKYLTNIDPLTGLYNSRYFHETLEREIAKAERYKSIVSLVIMDLDNFKWCNDNLGHQVGDTVLTEIGQMLSVLCRKADTAARWGGEEFAVILPRTSRTGAASQAERICSKVKDHPFQDGEPSLQGRITMSAGVASYPEDSTTAKALVHAADMALYQAKAMGKSRVCVAKPQKKRRH